MGGLDDRPRNQLGLRLIEDDGGPWGVHRPIMDYGSANDVKHRHATAFLIKKPTSGQTIAASAS